MKDNLHIAVACGGTGGHIFPGLATARALRDRGHHVTLWLSGKHVEGTVLQGWKGPVITIPSEGFQFGPLRSVVTAIRIFLAVIRCWIAMLRHRPDAVLAMGSYSSIGPCLAARLRGIPVVLHEANAIPGKAVRLLAGKAARIAICFEETRYHLKGLDLVTTGMPLRPELKSSEFRVSSSKFHLLVMGGSGGAHAVNEMVSQAVCLLKTRNPKLETHVTHLTGPADESHIRRRYEQAGVDAEVCAFTQEIAALYETADLAICRAGASTCAELGVFGLPSLLIPYPHAASDHQTANARALEKLGAAAVVQQADMTVEWLADYIRAQIDDPARLAKMRARALRPDSLEAAAKLAETVEQCVQK
ncbi:MAG: UDP-N-acetylglucosamine--N-acetylmuramyl-(pentapeptide) pyrophosphoryl-undecaprenol N-acetylglucosamine transferase [Kiritimatiellales bacterium]|nr:UDP-N-acetylglucosamine--N-acetylmuramyl-(pentapeptide) pyrophosphoryl-undecaprenol N-acetylglucosamine transferase [Kiritimatiellales bacterium]